MIKKLLYEYFSAQLIGWNSGTNSRIMPWKGEKDPYKIWLSEIILQQTRVGQGLEFYQKFIINFPSVIYLAQAPDVEIFKLWEGLGYYTRCKNLIATARYIAEEKGGGFPETYEEILSLKGVGPYTAAAIASFAYNLPYAVVDGNVFRVLARFFGIATPIDGTAGKKLFTTLANELLDKEQPALHNQAIMDFGATVCKPKVPLCASCVLQTHCIAYARNVIHVLPVKEKKIIKKNRQFYYFITQFDNKVYINKRTGNDIWENLYEFMLAEDQFSPSADVEILSSIFSKNFHAKNFIIGKISNVYKQQLTHQTIQARFIHVELTSALPLTKYELIAIEHIKNLPFPKIVTAYFEDKNGFYI